MSRQTIDYGIYLGAEYSCIAVSRGTNVELFRNNKGLESTPSAVYIDKKDRLWVGQKAKQETELDPENAVGDFIRQMGNSKEYRFARSGRVMKPEELSAEVLKSLKADVRQRTGEDVQAAVITVPAAFELPQCEATNRAAQLAGFSVSPLLQEPVAAAIAYGFQSESDKVFWLVYDFGGGTFDAAVIQVRDGVIQVVNHGGDNHLGGKLLDWEIVDQLLAPEVRRRYKLADFRRGNSRWLGAFAKLKHAAEEAKIKVSRMDSDDIEVAGLCQDGDAVDFDFELRRSEVERLAEPFILRSVNICKRVLAEKNLKPEDIEKLILVGGPTLMPYLKDRLADRKDGLGIPLEFSVDPLTIVARGAAIFSGTQRLEGQPVVVAPGQYAVELDYKPIGSDTEPLVGGRVTTSGGQALSGFTIEFINEQTRPQWRSGKLGLSPEGTFVTNLWAQKGPANTFLIQLCNASGTICSTVPDRFTYTVGLVPTDPPLIHSVGVALADNKVELFLEKGTPLPARKRISLRTAVELRRGQEGSLLKVPVIEGENVKRADRNRLIGSLSVSPHQLSCDIPVGSDVEVTIIIDKSRLVQTRAFIPISDQEFETEQKLQKEVADTDSLRTDAEKATKRLDELRAKARTAAGARPSEILGRIDREQMPHNVETSLEASRGDADAADKCEKNLLELNVAMDQLEQALEWPNLIKESEQALREAQQLIQKQGSASDKQALAVLETEISRAIGSHDADFLRLKVDELSALYYRILRDQPAFWVGFLDYLEKMRSDMTDLGQADQWISQARRAINNNDLAALKAACLQLRALLPAAEQQRVEQEGYGGTTTR